MQKPEYYTLMHTCGMYRDFESLSEAKKEGLEHTISCRLGVLMGKNTLSIHPKKGVSEPAGTPLVFVVDADKGKEWKESND